MNAENDDWLSCQIAGISDHICGPAGASIDLGTLREISLAFQEASRRIEQLVAKRVAAGACPHEVPA